MALSIKNKEYEEVARELARVTGKSITEAGLVGLKRELDRQKTIKSAQARPRRNSDELYAAIREIQKKYAALPSKSTLTDDEVLGYDEFGAPTK